MPPAPPFRCATDTDDAKSARLNALTLGRLTFIADHPMVVWRFHDCAHRMQPDIIANGVTSAFGLQRTQMHDVGLQLRVVDEARVWKTVEWIDESCSTLT